MARTKERGTKEWYVEELKHAAKVIQDRAREIIGEPDMTARIDLHIEIEPTGITVIHADKEILSVPKRNEITQKKKRKRFNILREVKKWLRIGRDHFTIALSGKGQGRHIKGQ